jgi:hypothetical protein
MTMVEERTIKLNLSRADAADLVGLAETGLGAIEDFQLAQSTGLADRVIVAVHKSGKTELTPAEARALEVAAHRGMEAVRTFGLPVGACADAAVVKLRPAIPAA